MAIVWSYNMQITVLVSTDTLFLGIGLLRKWRFLLVGNKTFYSINHEFHPCTVDYRRIYWERGVLVGNNHLEARYWKSFELPRRYVTPAREWDRIEPVWGSLWYSSVSSTYVF